MPHIIIDGTNYRPPRTEPVHGFWQTVGAGVALVLFVIGTAVMCGVLS